MAPNQENQWDQDGGFHIRWDHNQWAGQDAPTPSRPEMYSDHTLGRKGVRRFALLAPHQYKQDVETCWAAALASWRPAQQGLDNRKFSTIPTEAHDLPVSPSEILEEYEKYITSEGALIPIFWPDVAIKERIDYSNINGSQISGQLVLNKLREKGYLYWTRQASASSKFAHVVVCYGILWGEKNAQSILVMEPVSGALKKEGLEFIKNYNLHMIGWRGVGNQITQP